MLKINNFFTGTGKKQFFKLNNTDFCRRASGDCQKMVLLNSFNPFKIVKVKIE